MLIKSNRKFAHVPSRTRLLAATISGLVVLLSLSACLSTQSHAALHARLDVPNPDHVKLLDPIVVQFDHRVDLKSVQVLLTPASQFNLEPLRDRLVITPLDHWQAGQHYSLALSDVPSDDHKSVLKAWTGAFETQPKVSVAGYRANDQAVTGTANIPLHSRISVVFTVPMRPATVTLTSGGEAIPSQQLSWSPDATLVSLNSPVLVPYAPVTLGVGPGALSAEGDPLADGGQVTLVPQALEPSNSSSGIDGSFQPKAPLQVVIENGPGSRPQEGLQQADMVWEYMTEYGVSRMTAQYFDQPPNLMGPLRSCRMVNPLLNFAFSALTMCAGASVGTLHYMFGGGGTDIPLVPGVIEDFDRTPNTHFFRGSGFAPHNLYTTAGHANRLRTEWAGVPKPTYQVDPPHPDNQQGTPSDPPSAPLQGASYSFDPGSQQYLAFDQGSPWIQRDTGQQLMVKNVVLLNVPFHDAGWVEDENGGARSTWYELLGTGRAQIWSGGRLINATWHMGQGPNYWENHQPLWFSDEQGRPVELNTGLTWIHVLGQGQYG